MFGVYCSCFTCSNNTFNTVQVFEHVHALIQYTVKRNSIYVKSAAVLTAGGNKRQVHKGDLEEIFALHSPPVYTTYSIPLVYCIDVIMHCRIIDCALCIAQHYIQIHKDS